MAKTCITIERAFGTIALCHMKSSVSDLGFGKYSKNESFDIRICNHYQVNT
jgi:hypothetical protein